MKSGRRHELQTNELADFLSHGLEKYRQHLPNIIWGIVALAAVIAAITLWSSRSGSSQAHAWEEFDQIRGVDSKVRPKRLKELAERYPNSDIALWARIDLADQLCFDGRERMALDREAAVTLLREAQQTYAAVLEDPKARPEMIRRAALNEAKCWELMGEREKAIASYKAVAQRLRTMLPAIAENAEAQAAALEQPEAADFYKWLAEYKPPSAPSLNLPNFGPGFPPLGDERKESEAPTSAPESSTSPPESKTSEPPTEPPTDPPTSNDPPVSQPPAKESANQDERAEKPADPR
jgi:hypothetical protein